MTAHAYVLIKAQVGKTAEVRKQLLGQPGIEAADIVTGPYDIIVRVQGADLNDIGKLVLNTLHGVQGVESTLTCQVVQ